MVIKSYIFIVFDTTHINGQGNSNGELQSYKDLEHLKLHLQDFNIYTWSLVTAE